MLDKIFRKPLQTPPVVLPEVKPNFPFDKVEAAFESDGVTYYKFMDPAEMSITRWEAAQDRILEVENRVTREYLELHCKLTRDALNKGDLQEAAYLNRFLEERLQYLSNVEFLYNLASVWYFDANEGIADYSFEYADKKIARWRKDPETVSFFLASPLKNYMRWQDTSGMSMQNYSRAVLQEERALLSTLLPRLSRENANPDIITATSSRLETLNEWIESLK